MIGYIEKARKGDRRLPVTNGAGGRRRQTLEENATREADASEPSVPHQHIRSVRNGKSGTSSRKR